MSQFTDGLRKGFASGATLVGKQFYIVKVGTVDGSVILAAAATDKLVGTLNSAPKAATENVEVALRSGGGTHKVIAGGTIAYGDYITSDSAGKAVATTTTGNVLLGMALEAAAAGDIFEYMPMTDRY